MSRITRLHKLFISADIYTAFSLNHEYTRLQRLIISEILGVLGFTRPRAQKRPFITTTNPRAQTVFLLSGYERHSRWKVSAFGLVCQLQIQAAWVPRFSELLDHQLVQQGVLAFEKFLLKKPKMHGLESQLRPFSPLLERLGAALRERLRGRA